MKTVWRHILKNDIQGPLSEYQMKAGKSIQYKLVHTNKSSKYEYDAHDDERLNGRQSISPGDIAGDAVEYVDEDEEDCDEDRHPARDTLGGNEEADPADNDEHSSWEVVSDDVVRPGWVEVSGDCTK